MAITNRERVGRGLEFLTQGLRPFVERELKAQLGGYWLDKVKGRVRVQVERDGRVHWDPQGLLKCMVDFWQEVFIKTLGHYERALVGELIEVRNVWAHEKPITSEDAQRALDTMERLLKAVSAQTQADELNKLRTDLLRSVFAEQARNQTRYQLAIEGEPKAGLKPWRMVVTPHKDVQSGRYMQAEFAADLAQVHAGGASEEYRDPTEFFRRTYITAGLQDLLVGALQRLSKAGGDPVVELQTNFGGGKTHSMLALYHLFGGTPASKLPGVEPVLKQASVAKIPTAKRVVLVGSALSPADGAVKSDGVTTRTLWGELAWQLGGKAGYAMVAESDAKGTSPGSDALAKLLKKFSPCLVLVDEWVAYARQLVGKDDVAAGRFEAQATFAQALTEAAKAVPDALVVASIPASDVEIGGEHGKYALETLKNVFERVAKPWRPATGDEGFEIVRRRLFEPLSGDAFAARDAVVDAFAKMYRESAQDFPSGCGEGSYRRELEAAYPIHPELFRRLYDDWSTLDKFQRTRGVLRLLAKVIHRLWESQDSGLLIMPASIPLDDGAVRSEVTRYLEDVWEPIIDQEIDGPNSMPLEIDRSAPNLGRYSACRRVARTLYVGTAPGASSRNPGIDDRRVRLGSAQPGESIATFGDALRRIADRARHIHQDANRYWVSPKANLNRLADDRSNTFRSEHESLWKEIVDRLRADRDRGGFAGVHVCPETSVDVHDEPEARLVVLGPKAVHRKGQADSAALKSATEMLQSRGTSPRLYRNMLVFLAPDAQAMEDLAAATAQYLSWYSIVEDGKHETLNLDAYQTRQAESKRKSASETIDVRIRSTWIHLLVPNQAEPTADVRFDEHRVTANERLAARATAKLREHDALLPQLGGVVLRREMDRGGLWGDRNHVSFGDLADYFARYLYLPRVVNREVVRKAITDGAAQLSITDTFAVATAFDESHGRYTGLRLGAGGNVVIDNATLVVKPDIAQKQVPSVGPPPPSVPATAPTGAAGSDTGPLFTQTGAETRGPAKPRVLDTFVASVALDPRRIGSNAGKIAEEVVQHLSTLPGAEVEVTMEIRVHVPDGIKDDVIRVVRENCGTLRFKSHTFE